MCVLASVVAVACSCLGCVTPVKHKAHPLSLGRQNIEERAHLGYVAPVAITTVLTSRVRSPAPIFVSTMLAKSSTSHQLGVTLSNLFVGAAAAAAKVPSLSLRSK